MKLISPNNIDIYCLSNQNVRPEWISKKKRSKLNKTGVSEAEKHKIEILQDLEMPTVTKSLCLSKDGNFMIAAGTYKPRIRCYDLHEMTLKFERCVDYEIQKIICLDDDYTKLMLLQENRFVEFHVSEGKYHRLRLPHFSRDAKLYEMTGQILFAGTSPDLVRFDCNLGRFVKCLTCLDDDAFKVSSINTLDVNENHGLIIGGTDRGILYSWDIRTRCEAISYLDVRESILNCGELTACKFLPGNVEMAVGTDNGQILIYDIRAKKPRLMKDHNYECAIKGIKCAENSLNEYFRDGDKLIYSHDERAVKIWNLSDGAPITAIELDHCINDICVVENTGLIFTALEDSLIQPFFIGEIGNAPKWCSYLDKITDDFDSAKLTCETGNMYDDYRFATRDEIVQLGLANLIGTNSLRAYMHGYYIDNSIYRTAKDRYEIFNLTKYKIERETEKSVKKDEEIEKCLNNLSTLECNVNKQLLSRCKQLLEFGDKKQIKASFQVLNDDRFSNIFLDNDYAIDTTSEDFKLLNAGTSFLQKLTNQDQFTEPIEKVDKKIKIQRVSIEPIEEKNVPKFKKFNTVNLNQTNLSILSQNVEKLVNKRAKYLESEEILLHKVDV